MSNRSRADEPPLGTFPFPLPSCQSESRYLQWIRNHSNYMAERGFLDYLRIAAVVLRGISINFLTLLPYLLVVGLVLALLHTTMVQYPFYLTGAILMLGAAWVILFPVFSRISNIGRHRRSLETGSGTSVKGRDFLERTFGASLLLLLGVFLIEALQWGLGRFRDLITLRYSLLALAGASLVVVVASKFLPALAGAKKRLAMVLVGVLGLLVPLLVVLDVIKYVTASDPEKPSGLHYLALAVLPLLGALCFMIAIAVALFKRALELREQLRLMVSGVLLLVLPAVLFGAAFLLIDKFEDPPVDEARFLLVLGWAIEIWLFCWLAVDVNLTSPHGLYRDRLASAYLIGINTDEEVDIEEDLDLRDICCHEARSIAPYHLVNVALNLQGSADVGLRDRKCDFFVFSKRFIGGPRTGYCHSEAMEMVHPVMSLAVAMAISAAAASPNMGRSTNPLTVAFMTLLNVRLGYWIPRPGLLEARLEWRALTRAERREKKRAWKALRRAERRRATPPWERSPLDFPQVFEEELTDVQRRWLQIYGEQRAPALDEGRRREPTTAHGLFGVAFSGGGIRSATVNLGIAQALEKRGVFDHFDLLSTVSGGGYLGSSLSTLMRYRTPPGTEISGTARRSSVEIGKNQVEQVVRIEPDDAGEKPREYRYSQDARLIVEDGDRVDAGSRLIARPGVGVAGKEHLAETAFQEQFHWRVPPGAFLREMGMRLDERHKWVNLSDGGHIENLACIELLRRRCRLIVAGDAEGDPKLHFNGLATLIRYARIDLNIQIDIDVDAIRLNDRRRSNKHWAIGKIVYPKRTPDEPGNEHGWLLYLKSSFTGDEDEVIQEYRHNNGEFPHETTADQFFDEGQFEAYRSLGQHIADGALEALGGALVSLGEHKPDRFGREQFARALDRLGSG